LDNLQEAKERFQWMLREGIRVNPVTYEKLFFSIMRRTPHKKQPQHIGRSLLVNPDCLTLHPSLVSNPDIRNALHVFLNSSWKNSLPRTKSMYSTMLISLRSQKEYIAAALVFELMVKDWKLLDTSGRLLKSNPAGLTDMPSEEHDRLEARYKQLLRTPIQPKDLSFAFDSLLNHVSYDIAMASSRPDPSLMTGPRQQLLAIFATLLNRRVLPLTNISSLIKAIFLNPPVQSCMVWVDVPSAPMAVDSHEYTHNAIRTLINNLPSYRYATNKPNAPSLPHLNLNTYNALLDGTLNVWKDFQAARKVFLHMTTIRVPPIKPNSDTISIIKSTPNAVRLMGLLNHPALPPGIKWPATTTTQKARSPWGSFTVNRNWKLPPLASSSSSGTNPEGIPL
jgi:hypothetical protein